MKITVEKNLNEETGLAKGISVSVDLSFLSDADVVICKIMKAVNDRLESPDIKQYADLDIAEDKTCVVISNDLVMNLYCAVRNFASPFICLLHSGHYMLECFRKEINGILKEARNDVSAGNK